MVVAAAVPLGLAFGIDLVGSGEGRCFAWFVDTVMLEPPVHAILLVPVVEHDAQSGFLGTFFGGLVSELRGLVLVRIVLERLTRCHDGNLHGGLRKVPACFADLVALVAVVVVVVEVPVVSTSAETLVIANRTTMVDPRPDKHLAIVNVRFHRRDEFVDLFHGGVPVANFDMVLGSHIEVIGFHAQCVLECLCASDVAVLGVQ